MVAILGATVAFTANALSPRGLKLSRNYFPKPAPSVPAITPAAPATNAGPKAGATNTASPAELLAARLREKGLVLVDSNRVSELFRDPRWEQDLVVFIDARDDPHYQGGHIPNAYQFDYYHPENYLATVLQVCQIAERIVVYCNGGNCEDSELAATMLRDAGIPKDKLLVYGGGMTEWTTNGLPVELGQRKSGNLRK
ncbi:MAG TPA: rhodanese-like domain-containing protein [Bacillota bacterium]|nr:rhodanese-like domain-containing protein [Bacillota bacterium]